MNEMSDLRRKVASLARNLYAKKITFDEFLAGTPEMEKDELIDELVDLIEHEPAIGRVFGVSKEEHEKYIQKVFKIIEQLEKNAT